MKGALAIHFHLVLAISIQVKWMHGRQVSCPAKVSLPQLSIEQGDMRSHV